MRKGVLEKLGYAELIEKLPPLAKPQDEQAESEEDTSEGAQET